MDENLNHASDTRQSRPLWRRFCGGLGIILAVASVAGWMAGEMAEGWPLNLACHFQVQYGATLTVATALLYVSRRRYLAVITSTGVFVAATIILPIYVPRPQGDLSNAPKLRLVSLNVQYNHPNHAQVVRFLETADADLILLFETTPEWVESLAPLKSRYATFRAYDSQSVKGIVVLSRVPLRWSEFVMLAHSTPAADISLRLDGRKLSILAVHAMPPVNPELAEQQHLQLRGSSFAVAETRGAKLMIGDLNTTPWSPVFADVLRITGLRDSRQGFGLHPTWPVGNPLTRIPIDHCLVSPEVAVIDRWLGPDVGSDHFPIIVDIAILETARRRTGE